MRLKTVIGFQVQNFFVEIAIDEKAYFHRFVLGQVLDMATTPAVSPLLFPLSPLLLLQQVKFLILVS